MRERSGIGLWMICAVVAALALGSGRSAAEGPGPREAALRGPGEPLTTLTGIGAQRVLLEVGTLTRERREALRSAGVRVGEVVRPGVVAARLDGADAEALERLGFIRSQRAFRPEWKIAEGTGARDYREPDRRRLAEEGLALVNVHLFRGASAGEVRDVVGTIRALGRSEIHRRASVGGVNSVVARVARVDLPLLAEHPAVQRIEDVPEVVPRRNSTVRPAVQTPDASATPLYDLYGLTGEGQVIGVIDGAVDPGHCSFEDAVPIGPGHRKIVAYNSPAGVDPHGTHVAATALGDSGLDDDLRGVAYGARMAFAVTPDFTQSGLYNALQLHHQQGARVHTNSWGNDDTTTYDGLARAIDAFSHDHEDDLVIFAASNMPTLHNPENAKNVLAVGATERVPMIDVVGSGGQGPTSDGRRKPEVFAPGIGTISARSGSACGTRTLSGTSMATAAVAGAAAIVRQYFTEGWYPTGTQVSGDAITPSGALLRAVLINSARDMTGEPGYPSNAEGWGRVALVETLSFAGDPHALIVEDIRNADGLSTGSVFEREVQVSSAGEPLRVTLVWTDPPGAPGSIEPLVNDLDLELVAPDASVYRGNVFAGGASVPGGAPDGANTVERVVLPAPQVGTYTVRVVGAAVNEGLQGFALALNGALVAGPEPLRVVAIDAPGVIAPGGQAMFHVRVDSGDEALVPSSVTLYSRAGGGAYTPTTAIDLGGGLFRVTLPAFACGETPEFYVAAQGDVSGERLWPLGAPGAGATAQVGEISEVLLWEESFENGLPETWSASGPWKVSDLCVSGTPCDGPSWAYFGFEGSCTYANGFRVVGSLTAPAMALPSEGEIALEFCSNLETEDFGGFDVASVFVGEAAVVRPVFSHGSWEVESVDLTAFAGQTVSPAFTFDSVDGGFNAFRGWQVDRVRLLHRVVECTAPVCEGDADGDSMVTVNDITYVVRKLGESGPAGDVDGSGVVDVNDIVFIVGRLGDGC